MITKSKRSLPFSMHLLKWWRIALHLLNLNNCMLFKEVVETTCVKYSHSSDTVWIRRTVI